LTVYTEGPTPPTLAPNDCLAQCALGSCGDPERLPCQRRCRSGTSQCFCARREVYPPYPLDVLTATSGPHSNCSAVMSKCLSTRMCTCIDGGRIVHASAIAFTAGLIAIIFPAAILGATFCIRAGLEEKQTLAQYDHRLQRALTGGMMIWAIVTPTLLITGGVLVVDADHQDSHKNIYDQANFVRCGQNYTAHDARVLYILCFVTAGFISIGVISAIIQSIKNHKCIAKPDGSEYGIVLKKTDRHKCDQIFRICDKNQDGYLDFEEALFLNNITSDQHMTFAEWVQICTALGAEDQKLTQDQFYRSYTELQAGSISEDYQIVKAVLESASTPESISG